MRTFTTILPVWLAGALAACQSEQVREPPDIPVTRLEPAEAARLARAGREEVPAQVADGLELRLWAPEPLLIDPVALAVDNQGDVYVSGSNRSNITVDIRWHPDWTTEVLGFQTVVDLRAFFRRVMASEQSAGNAEWLPDLNADGSHDWRDLTVQTEHVYRIRDASGDGLADTSERLLDGFNDEVTDVVGGVLVHDGDLYVAAAPDLWRYRDTTGDGAVDSGESISHGYGVHPGLFGHGMSGVTLGPDGRIYWSIGDLGFTVTDSAGRRWSYPNQGAVLRAEPDGSGFEVFAAGLRNTHEIAFDELGNLISVDNDGDLPPDEVERVVYIVEGSDSGWRTNWQFGKYTEPDNNDYNAWVEEGLFRPRFPGQAAYITPPIASYHNGPAGMAYNPGTALSERWRGHFFIGLFTGTPSRSSVRAFRLEPRGATFDMVADTAVLSGILPTGMAFGPDGALYIADWVEGWASTGRGRVWKLDDPDAAASELRAQTRVLLAEPFDRRPDADLGALLAHADTRVRLKAQFELARRGGASTLEDVVLGSLPVPEEASASAARRPPRQPSAAGGGSQGARLSPQRGEAARGALVHAEPRLARLHGIWGIGQLARADAQRAAPLAALLADEDAEVRAQAAKTIGDVRYGAAADALVALLEDTVPRVRFFAAEALGRIGHRTAVQPLIAMLEANNDADAYIRHAGTLALARIGDAEALLRLADHPSRALRVAAVVALRRMRHPGVARFLADDDEYIVTEAARAINDDASIEPALPALAAMLDDSRFSNEALLRRALNANLRIGTAEAAQRVAAFAMRASAAEPMRVEAVEVLGVFPRPSRLDRVVGIWHGPIERDPSLARAAALPLIEPILGRGAATPLKIAFAQTAARLRLDAAIPSLLTRVQTDATPEVRIAALEALHALRAESIETAARAAFADRDPSVRRAALTLISELELSAGSSVKLLASVLERGPVGDRQTALDALGDIGGDHASAVLAGVFDQLVAGRLAPELELELIEAIDAGGDLALKRRLTDYRDAIAEGGGGAAFREALRGGNADNGQSIVWQSQEAQCMRCHVVDGEGSNVGPELTRIGASLTREQILEALIDPTARIAPGFGNVTLTLTDGATISGLLREETTSHVVIETAADERQRIERTRITRRINAPSAMPAMERVLSRRELRDVVEYLSGLE